MATPLATARFGAGSVPDFGAWMASEQRRVFALCQRLLQDPDEADSATQDVFLKAYQALLREEERGEDGKVLDDPTRWLSRIAVNTCLNQIRHEKHRPELRMADLSEEAASVVEQLAASPDELGSSEKFAARELVDKLLAGLRPPDRLLMRLWLSVPNSRALPEDHAILWGDVGGGRPHGGIAQPATAIVV